MAKVINDYEYAKTVIRECLWYNGEVGVYELLDFNPNGLTEEQIIKKARKELINKGFFGEELDKAMETVYLINIDDLHKLIKK